MGLVKSKSKSNRYANNEDTAGEGEDKKVGGERPSTMIASKMIHLPKPHGEEACIGIASCNSSFKNDLISVGDDKKVHLVDIKSGKLTYSWSGHEKCVNKAVHGHNNDLLYTASRDTTVKVWKREHATPLTTFKGHELTISAIDINESDSLLITGSRDYCVKVFDISTSKEIVNKKISLNMVTCMQWIVGTSTFAQGSEDLKLRIWDYRDKSLNPAISIEGYVYFPLDLDMASDGFHVLTSSKGFNSVGCEGRLWDLRSQKQLVQFNGHEQDACCCLLFNHSNSGRMFAITASKDKSIRVWNCESGVCLSQTQELDSGAFTGLCKAVPGCGVDIFASSFSGYLFGYNISEEGKLMCVARSSINGGVGGADDEDVVFSSI